MKLETDRRKTTAEGDEREVCGRIGWETHYIDRKHTNVNNKYVNIDNKFTITTTIAKSCEFLEKDTKFQSKKSGFNTRY